MASQELWVTFVVLLQVWKLQKPFIIFAWTTKLFIYTSQIRYISVFVFHRTTTKTNKKNVWKNIVVSKQRQFHFKNSLRVLIKKVEKNNRKQQKHIRRTFMALLKIKAIYYVSQKAKRLKKTQRKTALLIKMPQGTVFPIFEAFFFFAWECIVIFDK